jgi:Putative exonuclease SbcCD, C subunit
MTSKITREPTLWQKTDAIDSAESAEAQADHLQQLPDGPQGYRLRRVILTNFWLYEHQEFEIPHGRLFLAGENASGKSTVLMAALPLCLDGDYRPERIDTFGKREKRIDYYVIGSNESATPFQRDQRTSYIALEFEWCDMQQPPFASELRSYWEQGNYERARFLTIGIVLSGNRSNVHPVTAFRFLITDGSRLEKSEEFSTYQTLRDGGRRAYDMKTFKKMVAEHGIVCDTVREYEPKVAQYLFNFTNVADFRRLIRQLLYLRQPNLNSVLSLETVRTFLDQSLPQIPDDLLQHAANTLELMDTLQDEIVRRRQAYNAVERLHAAQQSLTIAKARLAACEYIHQHYQESAANSEVQRLRRQLTRAENELRRWLQRIEELEREQAQVTGKIAAIEGSEGLQAVQRLNQVSTRMRDLERTLADHQQILEDTISRREQNAQDVSDHQRLFEQARLSATQLLAEMRSKASDKAYWESAAEQIITIQTQIQQLNLEQPTSNLITTLPVLLPTNVNARSAWLKSLRQLHQNLDHEATNQRAAQQQETRLYEEVDEVTRAFEDEREEAYSALQELADQLDTLIEQVEQIPLSDFTDLHEQVVETYNSALSPSESVSQLDLLVQAYADGIDRALASIDAVQKQLQARANELRDSQGSKAQEVRQAEEAYQRKLQEPEYVPQRSMHRSQAREKLAAASIPSFPLYKLIDFIPEIDGQSPLAGGIEYMLEDAGLLDALVVLPMHSDSVDMLLEEADLSDCRLQLPASVGVEAGPGQVPPPRMPARWLRVDPAMQEQLGAEYPVWAEHVEGIITTIEYTLYPDRQLQRWQHGLLSGNRGEGAALCIGKANREREQRQAIERLYQRWQQLTGELQQLAASLAEVEQQRQHLVMARDQFGTVMRSSQVENHAIALHNKRDTLERTQENYRIARNETQTIRQRIQSLRVQLHKEADGMDLFINNAESINQALESINALVSDAQVLHGHLQNVLRELGGYSKAVNLREQARVAEFRAAQAHKRIEKEAEQVRAEFATLQQVLKELEDENVEGLFAQLRDLQERQQAIPPEMQDARDAKTKNETILSSNQENFTRAQETLTQAQQERERGYQELLGQIASYPVERLQIVYKQLNNGPDLDTIQSLLDEPLSNQEEDYHASKRLSEEQKNTAYNALFQIYSEVNSLLHEYGTTFDPQGTIRFVNADSATPFELLIRLAEEISQQERLLDERERTLFQNFLLQEMADTIRKHIVDAEDWINKMNSVLGHTAFVGEHYHLGWVAREREQIRSGGHLAQHYQLLRRQAQTLKEEEVEALVNAFRQEIANLRAEQQANQNAANALPFADALARIFDYRDWFRFEIYVSRSDGTRQHLTERYFKQRSGAEQYIALYVPFFAALSALYESAGKGAPRLIALDEAFDKVSLANTQLLLKFLASQQFQWIMTGPRVSGEGTEIPACARYVMLHHKGSELATGFPSFWSSEKNKKG